MSQVDKVSNVLDDRKQELVATPLLEKKSLTKDYDKGTDELVDTPLLEKKPPTKDVDKGTDKLEDMKKAVVTICRKGLDKFEGQYKGSIGQFKIDSGFLKTTFSTINSEFQNELFEKNIDDQDTGIYTAFIVPFDRESINTKYKKGPKMITQSEAPAPE